jgi:hypothetical protein
MKTLTSALRPWTIDFHVAQNDATVKGSGTHDKTGHHCLPDDPNGKLSIAHHAGYWLHGSDGRLSKAFNHICWDGCMFPNAVMMQQQTWNNILSTMIAVRDAHGWRDDEEEEAEEPYAVEVGSTSRTKQPRPATKRKPVKKAVKAAAKTKKAPKRPVKRKAAKVMAKKRSAKKVSRKAKSSRKSAKKKGGKRKR